MSRLLAGVRHAEELRHKHQINGGAHKGQDSAAAAGSEAAAPSPAGDQEHHNSPAGDVQTSSGMGRGEPGGSHGLTMMIQRTSLPWGLATTEEERDHQGVKALVPRRVVDRQAEVDRALAAVRAAGGGMAGHCALLAVRSFSPAVFHALLQQNVEELLPLVYTPTVGDACLQWGTLYPRPPGLYITLEDRGRVAEVLRQWTHPHPKIAIVTDGERILGLGDLGAHGMGIPAGKRSVYAACGVAPQWVVPIGVDVGCSRDDIRDDPHYVGLPRGRAHGQEYWSFILEELVPEMRKLWGDELVVHWEDISRCSAYRLLQDLRDHQIPTFDDDIECTAVATVAALMAAGRVEGGPPLEEQRFLLFGAGQANIGAARLLRLALKQAGMSEEEAAARLWLVDSHGLVTTKREDASKEKREFAREAPAGTSEEELRHLDRVVKAVKPTTLVGAAAVGGAFSKDVIEALIEVAGEQLNEKHSRPVVLALSNPTDRAECTFEQAVQWSQGRVIYASGTRFPALEVDLGNGTKHTVEPGQVNNCFVFPGIGLGSVVSGGSRITEEVFLASASALAGAVTKEDVRRGTLTPRFDQLREVALQVATGVAAAAFQTNEQARKAAAQGEKAADTHKDDKPASLTSNALCAYQAGGRAELRKFVSSIMYDAIHS